MNKGKSPRRDYNVEGITDGALKRLSRKAGVLITGTDTYDYVRELVDYFTASIITDALKLAKESKRTKLSLADLVAVIEARNLA